MLTHRIMSYSLGLMILAGCTTPGAGTPPVGTAPSASAQPTAAPSVAPTEMPTATPTAAASKAPAPDAPFPASTGSRFGQIDLVAPAFAGFDSQQGLVYVADVLDPLAGTPRYNLVKINASGAAVSKNALAVGDAQAPTRVDGLAVNLSGLPIVNTLDDNRFMLVKVAGASTVAADRYPVNNLVYTRLSASASAENGKYLTVAALHRSADSVNTGPEFISVGRAEEDKAPTMLTRVNDPLSPTARLTVTADGVVYVAGPTKEGKLAVVMIKTDGTQEPLPIELPSVPDRMAIAPNGRLYLVWNFGGQPAKVRTVDVQGIWSAESELKLAAGDYLTQVSSIAFDTNGRAAITGSGFDAAGKSMKAVFLYSK